MGNKCYCLKNNDNGIDVDVRNRNNKVVCNRDERVERVERVDVLICDNDDDDDNDDEEDDEEKKIDNNIS